MKDGGGVSSAMDNGRLTTLADLSRYPLARRSQYQRERGNGGTSDVVAFPKSSKAEKEGVMTDYSTLVVVFLMLPVLVQIFLPLLLLVGHGLIRMIKVVFWGPGEVDRTTILEEVSGDIHPSRT